MDHSEQRLQVIWKSVVVMLVIVYGTIEWIYSQESPGNEPQSDRFTVEWVGEVTPQDSRARKNLINKIGQLVFGTDPVLLSKPVAVMARSPEQMWILDRNSRALFEYTNGQERLPGSLKKDKEYLPSLVDMTVLADGAILFTDSYRNQVFRLAPGGEDCQVLNESIVLEQPTGIAYSEVSDRVWVVETASHCISVLTPEGKRLQKIGKRGTGPGEFNFPTSIWIDKKGDVFIVDAMNFRIQVFDARGEFISVFGKIGNATGYFASPKGIATDHFGNIYVVDALFHSVQVFNRHGDLLSYFGSQGQEKEQFWLPSGIFIDEMNRIYVADSYNSRIQIFQIKNMAE